MRRILGCGLMLALLGFTQCSQEKKPTMFELLNPEQTGVSFENTITEDDSFNVMTFEYIYNGGGVGVADFNNDQRPDIFFAGNKVSSKCYLNRGQFRFDDITESANLKTDRWCTGVAVHDFNQDGWMDLYVCTVNPKADLFSDNLLFINKGIDANGIPVFEEIADKAGVAAHAYSTQASFLDYDNDGDMDMYLVTNSLESYPKNNPVGQNDQGRGKSQDKLYRNDSDSSRVYFTDVSKEAGILTEGWGLGITVSDINQDGFSDIYVANDFLSNDHLYINNGNGTFTNQIKNYFTHTEFNGMGIDIADINNDGLNDVLSVDMFPDDNARQKAMFSTTGYSKFALQKKQKYLTQYVRNVLQINNGNNTFSDVGCLSGIYDTDWSWSALMADFDNDGWRDILITNGYKKDITDLDFVSYSASATLFGAAADKAKAFKAEIDKLIGVSKPNFIFKNNGDLTFTDETIPWGLDQPSYSNGAAYADFDNDGDLDIVVNNINAPAFVYRNMLSDGDRLRNYINMSFQGSTKNRNGLGAKVYVYCNGQTQFGENAQQRGFKSSVEQTMHFGIGNCSTVDSVKVIWPSRKQQVITHLSANQTVLLTESNATLPLRPAVKPDDQIFHPSSGKHGIRYLHTEEDFVDFKQGQSLILHKFSQAGPHVATGDVNGDGLDDFIVGGSADRSQTLFLQQQNGTFKQKESPVKSTEDEGILLFDADADHDLDLFCVSGSSEWGTQSPLYAHRLYTNNGRGDFTLEERALDAGINASGSCVEACDYDKDGDLDLFVGGRVVPNRYPETPKSFLLKNESTKGHPRFIDAGNNALTTVGMVTSAVWVDFDNDTWMDLVVVGEWMPLTFLRNEKGNLKRMESKALPGSVGWWRCIRAADFDGDGDQDFIVGNFGLNAIYRASPEQPVTLYAKDFDQNGSMDPIVCRYIQGKEYPTHPRETMTEQIVSLKKKLTSYAKYGQSTLTDMLSIDQMKDATVLKCDELSSCYVENLGGGSFKMKPLPIDCQTAPINDLMIDDVNGDGFIDVLAVQNDYSFEPLGGYYDAGIGLVLLSDGKGNFNKRSVTKTGFCVRGDSRSIAKVRLKHGNTLYLATQNQDSLVVFERSR